MTNVYATTAIPESLQWWGWGREATSGTLVMPTLSMPLEKGLPDDKQTMLLDKMLRGYMGEDYDAVPGVQIADMPVSGDVYLDSIGHPMFNMFGDYQASGSSPANATTLNGAVVAGATTVTVTSGTGYTIGNNVQIGTTGTSPYEIVTLTGVSTNVLTFTGTPLRFNHATGAAVASVSAPFSHTFSLLNGSGLFGTSTNGQPVTHTVTYHQGLAASTQARQYGYWCCSGMDFKMNSEQLFQHDTKGTSLLGQIAGSAPSNSQSTYEAIPDWEFKVGIGGPASGGTLVNNVLEADVSWARGLKVDYGLNGQQAPYIIGRLGLSCTGKLSFLAQDESPLLTYLAGTKQQLQIAMTSGSGANLIGVTFNFNNAFYETATLTAPDMLGWDVSWRALMNSTNAGASGGQSPGSIVLQNNVPTY